MQSPQHPYHKVRQLMKNRAAVFFAVAREILRALTVILALSLVLEVFFPGIVALTISLDYLAIIVVLYFGVYYFLARQFRADSVKP